MPPASAREMVREVELLVPSMLIEITPEDEKLISLVINQMPMQVHMCRCHYVLYMYVHTFVILCSGSG